MAATFRGPDPMGGSDAHTGTARDPREASRLLELRNLPDRRRKLRLLDAGPAADGERPAVESLDTRDRRSPLMPAFDVAQHRPDAFRRGTNIDVGTEECHGGGTREDVAQHF